MALREVQGGAGLTVGFPIRLARHVRPKAGNIPHGTEFLLKLPTNALFYLNPLISG